MRINWEKRKDIEVKDDLLLLLQLKKKIKAKKLYFIYGWFCKSSRTFLEVKIKFIIDDILCDRIYTIEIL